MKANYLIFLDDRESKIVIEAQKTLAETLEFNGCISDKFQEKVYTLSIQLFDLKEKQRKGNIDYSVYINEIKKQFEDLFDIYNIFSTSFKSSCKGLFYTMCSF